MDKVQARLIAEKFAAGICSEAEHEDFFKWLLDLPIAESHSLIEEYSGIFETLPMVAAHRELWEKINQRLDGQDEAAQKEYPAKGRLLILAKSRRKWMFAAAAVFLAMIGAGAFLWVKYPNKNTGDFAFNK
jgi:hypothetical protein